MGSYDRVEYRLVQQQETDSEGEDTIRRSRCREQIPLRVRAGGADRMNLSVYNRPLVQTLSLTVSLIGLILVITTIAWVGHFKGGVAFTQTEKGIDFNWHPILMTISLIFLYGNGAMIYRVIPPRNESHKLKLKLGHPAQLGGIAGCYSLWLSVDPWIPGIPLPQVLRRHPGSAPAFPPILRLQHPGVGRCRCSHGTPGESHLVQQGIWEEEC